MGCCIDNHIEVRWSPCCCPLVCLTAWASAVGMSQCLGVCFDVRSHLSCVAVGLCASSFVKSSLMESRGNPLENGSMLLGSAPSSELPLPLTSLLLPGEKVPYIDRTDPRCSGTC